ncbi:MAG: EF-P lysine aminoacylase EpmA [Xanthomonadales bacterium]|nr:EF-P lysine aminoacylase EpmA [Xanthomonadales bacterium]
MSPERAMALRMRLHAAIREFFAARGVREVETPILDPMGPCEPHIEGMRVLAPEGERFLRASPEFFHKRLLSLGFGDLFEIARVFRAGERGAHHRPEFTLLEWYRIGFDHWRLMAELEALLAVAFALVGRALRARRLSYREWFAPLGLDPFAAPREALLEALAAAGVPPPEACDRQAALELLAAAVLPRRHEPDELVLVHGFPAQQAAYARILAGDPPTAARFEAFVGPLELANGYWEVTDAAEQRQRFERDNAERRRLGRPERRPDPAVLAAFERGIPDCAGVALGLDRLLLAMLGGEDLAAIDPFA